MARDLGALSDTKPSANETKNEDEDAHAASRRVHFSQDHWEWEDDDDLANDPGILEPGSEIFSPEIYSVEPQARE